MNRDGRHFLQGAQVREMRTQMGWRLGYVLVTTGLVLVVVKSKRVISLWP